MSDNIPQPGIDSILEKLYRIAASSEARNDNGTFSYNGVPDAKAVLLEAIKGCKPEKKPTEGLEFTPEIVFDGGFNDGVSQYEQSLINLFGEKS